MSPLRLRLIKYEIICKCGVPRFSGGCRDKRAYPGRIMAFLRDVPVNGLLAGVTQPATLFRNHSVCPSLAGAAGRGSNSAIQPLKLSFSSPSWRSSLTTCSR